MAEARESFLISGVMRLCLFVSMLVVGLMVMLAPTANAAGDKGDGVRISFHMETEATDNPKMIFPYQVMGKRKFFRRIPEISKKDYASFIPFPADDKVSFGVVLQLRPAAARRISAITNANRQKWFLANAFGRVADVVFIDEPVTDGQLVIWKGLTLVEINKLDLFLPRKGEKKPRGKSKK